MQQRRRRRDKRESGWVEEGRNSMHVKKRRIKLNDGRKEREGGEGKVKYELEGRVGRR